MPRFTPIAIAVCSTLLCFAQNSSSRDVQSSVEQVLNAQVQAWNNHDLDAFMRGYWHSPDLTFFSGAQVSRGWEQALDRYRKRYLGEGREMGKLEFKNLNIEPLSSQAALVRGEWHLTTTDAKNPHGLFTLLLRKFPDGWKIIHDHTSAAE